MSTSNIKAIDAIQEAQKIAFAPFIFQAVVAMRKLNIFDAIFAARKKGGVDIAQLSEQLKISDYGLGVLLEITETYGIVSKNDDGKFQLTTTGYFLAYNKTVDVNINFTNEVCYKGLFHLDKAIETGQPEGLKELGHWDTIYEGLSQLNPEQQKSWFEFDHHYSDDIFAEALPHVFDTRTPKKLFDIGANTGKFTKQCCAFNEDVEITMVDLPGQLQKAKVNVTEAGFMNRVKTHEIDWLKDNPQIPEGADTLWLCQFLDCFSKPEMQKILQTCANAMDKEAELIIIETYTDRQKFDNAKFILEATSLYFTALANGNSKMYAAADVKEVAENAGLKITDDIQIGEYHTMFKCRKAV